MRTEKEVYLIFRRNIIFARHWFQEIANMKKKIMRTDHQKLTQEFETVTEENEVSSPVMYGTCWQQFLGKFGETSEFWSKHLMDVIIIVSLHLMYSHCKGSGIIPPSDAVSCVSSYIYQDLMAHVANFHGKAASILVSCMAWRTPKRHMAELYPTLNAFCDSLLKLVAGTYVPPNARVACWRKLQHVTIVQYHLAVVCRVEGLRVCS